MQEDTVVGLPRPGRTVESDPLLAVLRDGARRMLTQAIEAEVAEFLAIHADRLDEAGRRRVVRNGHAPEREIQTGIGPIAIRRPRVRDRAADEEARMRFASKVLPPFLRRTRNVEELLPWLYLKGISTGQFEETLTVLLGPDAPGLSSTTIRRLVATWQDEHERWQGRDLSTKRYVYVWADGVYFAPRLARDRACLRLQARQAGGEPLAPPERVRPPRRDHPRRALPQWRGHSRRRGARRCLNLIPQH
jgi:putative transposase